MTKTKANKKGKRRSNSSVMRFRDADIVITDPCYLIREREAWLRLCKVLERDSSPQKAPEWCGRMILAATLFGDWFCELRGGASGSIGSFAADSGTVCVAELTDEYRKALAGALPDLYTVIEGFTGVAKIAHARGECYVSITGTAKGKELNAWSRQVG